MLQSALDYASLLGFAVFPVGRDCRVPRCEHGCKDASKDPATIRALWRQPFNIACATGDASGVLVLDVDRKGEVDGFACLEALEARHGALPATWRSRTPSGGEHVWFRKPEGRGLINRVGLRIYNADGSVNERFPGLDIRTTGGSVAVPPSRKPTGNYSWIVDPTDCELADPPEWLLVMTDPPVIPPRERRSDAVPMHNADRAFRYIKAALDGECGDLARMGQNTGRNLRLFQASANLYALVGANLVPEAVVADALERAAADCGLVAEDGLHAVRATIKSGMQRGLANPREVAL